jgi:hypothetical protein
MRTEKEIRSNAEFTLFEIGQKKYKARALPINDAEEWLDKAAEVDDAETAVSNAVASFESSEKKKEARKAYGQSLLDCVCAYNPEWDKEEIEKAVTGEQLIDAFLTMKEISDPFERKQLIEAEKLQKNLKGLPPELIMKALSASQKQQS